MLCSTMRGTGASVRSQCSAQDFVKWHLGGSKLSREEWKCTRDCTGGGEIHPNQKNNHMDPTAKSQSSASANKSQEGENAEENLGKRYSFLLSAAHLILTKDGAPEVREHCLKGRWVQ